MALDFAIFLAELNPSTSRTVHVFPDIDSLDSVVNPVNLNVHYHEELVSRTVAEIKEYLDIMAEQYPLRVERLRSWYGRQVERQGKRAKDDGATISNLDLDSLCDTIKTAKSVKFFGGSSLGLLQRLIQRGIASNMQCYLQTVYTLLFFFIFFLFFFTVPRLLLIPSQGNL
jgi:hypothetical protein